METFRLEKCHSTCDSWNTFKQSGVHFIKHFLLSVKLWTNYLEGFCHIDFQCKLKTYVWAPVLYPIVKQYKEQRQTVQYWAHLTLGIIDYNTRPIFIYQNDKCYNRALMPFVMLSNLVQSFEDKTKRFYEMNIRWKSILSQWWPFWYSQLSSWVFIYFILFK